MAVGRLHRERVEARCSRQSYSSPHSSPCPRPRPCCIDNRSLGVGFGFGFSVPRKPNAERRGRADGTNVRQLCARRETSAHRPSILEIPEIGHARLRPSLCGTLSLLKAQTVSFGQKLAKRQIFRLVARIWRSALSTREQNAVERLVARDLHQKGSRVATRRERRTHCIERLESSSGHCPFVAYSREFEPRTALIAVCRDALGARCGAALHRAVAPEIAI